MPRPGERFESLFEQLLLLGGPGVAVEETHGLRGGLGPHTRHMLDIIHNVNYKKIEMQTKTCHK